MNCMNCGAYLMDMDLDYCPHCGCNVLIQKKVDYLSKCYYNQGLEKASIRDLSGAITCLKQSLAYNKLNIQARNLLGLVYFETGEVVAALSEWVISKNLQPTRNLASEYIGKLQANPNKLEAINETIKKYNHALYLCREGHEDMAAVQLKKILSQNSKLIKGYHLLALIQIKDEEWNKARRTLKKAIRIDKTNTTTLRFLREVDERTGVTTRLEKQKKGFFRSDPEERDTDIWGSDYAVRTPVYKEKSRISLFFTLMAGLAAGAAAFWLLAVPAIRQNIYREANRQIVKYSESLVSQGAELTRAQGKAEESDSTAEAVVRQIEEEKKKSSSYEALLSAYAYLLQEDYDSAALKIQNVYEDYLTEDMWSMYNAVCSDTGVSGIRSEDSDGENQDDGNYDDGGYDDGSYDDGNYDDGSYDGGSYDDESYSNDGNYDEYNDYNDYEG
ncbi:MAG: hypothetical protein SOY73_15960 [Blautia sp.]|nr:hypothetical protein [Blautia sp.]MDY4000555.1 hypothetical protein [Blautia sp.]